MTCTLHLGAAPGGDLGNYALMVGAWEVCVSGGGGGEGGVEVWGGGGGEGAVFKQQSLFIIENTSLFHPSSLFQLLLSGRNRSIDVVLHSSIHSVLTPGRPTTKHSCSAQCQYNVTRCGDYDDQIFVHGVVIILPCRPTTSYPSEAAL